MENNNNQTSFYQFSDQLGVQTNNFPYLSLNDLIWRSSYGSKKPEIRRNFDIRVGSGLDSNSTDSVSQSSDNNLKSSFNHNRKIESPQVGSNSNGSFKKGVFPKRSYNFNSVNGVDSNVMSNLKGKFNGKLIDPEEGNFNQQVYGKSVKKKKNKNNNKKNGNKIGGENRNGLEKRFKTLPPAESLPRNETMGGYLYVCNNDTVQENLKRQVFVKEEDRNMISIIINAAKCWSSAEAPHGSFEAFFNRTDESGLTVLELAVERKYMDAVELILLEDPAYSRGSRKSCLMRLIYKTVVDEDCKSIFKLLSETYEAGIDPCHKGVINLILAIQRRDKESVVSLLGNSKHLVTFAEDEGWTPLHYAAYYEFVSVLDLIIEAQKDVGFQFVYGDMVSTPLHVAAEYGYTSTVIRLMQLWPASSSAYTAVNKNGQNILHLAAAENRKEIVQGILKYCPERYKDKILKHQDANGDTPLHLLISNGCFIPELIKHKGLDTNAKNNKNWTPRDMLYFKDDIVSEQVQIKIALDDIQTNQSAWKFWGKNMEKRTDILESVVLPSKREKKDAIYNEHKKLLMDEKQGRMKKDLERYKKRTNTQIIVTALITTVTFTVAFAMPGGLHQSGEVNEGSVVLSQKTAFNAFMISDALALLLSTSSLFFYFLESMNEDPHQVSKLNVASTVLNIISVMAMMLTFIAGTYVVLSHSPALAITICVIGSLFFLLIIVMLIKIVYDHQVKKNEE